MGNLNKLQIIGRLGQDPEKKLLQNGSVVTNVSVAVSERWKDQSGNAQERTEWFRVNFWGKTAENMDMLCVKGSQVYVEGSIQTREWTDKDGNKRFTPEVKGFMFQILSDGRPRDQASAPPPQQQAPAPSPFGAASAQPQQQAYSQAQPPPQQTAFGYDSPPPGVDGGGFVEDDIPF